MSHREQLEARIKSLNSRIEISRYNRQKFEQVKQLLLEGERQLIIVQTEYQALRDSVKTLADYRVKQKKHDSNQITDTITAISNIVFPEYHYSYFLDGRQNGEYAHTELAYRDSKGNELIPKISNGNGLQQLVSLSCVVVITALSDVTPTLFLDESLSSISVDKAPLVGEILEQFTKYGFQLVMIEHCEELFYNINYHEIKLGNVNGVTKIISERYVTNREEFSGNEELEETYEPVNTTND